MAEINQDDLKKANELRAESAEELHAGLKKLKEMVDAVCAAVAIQMLPKEPGDTAHVLTHETDWAIEQVRMFAGGDLYELTSRMDDREERRDRVLEGGPLYTSEDYR